MHVVFDESNPFNLKKVKYIGVEFIFERLNQNKDQEDTTVKNDKREEPTIMTQQHNQHGQWLIGLSQDAINCDLMSGVRIRSFMINQVGNISFIFQTWT